MTSGCGIHRPMCLGVVGQRKEYASSLASQQSSSPRQSLRSLLSAETHRRTCGSYVTLVPPGRHCLASLAADRGGSGDQTGLRAAGGDRRACRVAAILCAGTTRSESRSLAAPRKNSPSLPLPPFSSFPDQQRLRAFHLTTGAVWATCSSRQVLCCPVRATCGRCVQDLIV